MTCEKPNQTVEATYSPPNRAANQIEYQVEVILLATSDNKHSALQIAASAEYRNYRT
jgi:hypothetical protein